MPDCSIIIVNYRSAGLLADCLASLVLFEKKEALEIIVVDNDSGDDSEKMLTSRFPFIRWIQMGYNAGFARANNEGIRQATADVVLLLNPDTILEEPVVQPLCRQFIDSDYVACGVQLLNADRSPQIAGNYAMTGGLNYLLPLPYAGAALRTIALGLSVKKPNVPDASEIVEVDWINGAFLMVKKQVIAKAGLLDEDFFLYAEEAEWCSRLKKQGKLCIYGQYHVIHLQGEAANMAFNSEGKGYYNLFDRKGLQIMLSNFVRIRKEFGLAWYIFHMLFFTLEIPVFFVGLLAGSLVFWKKNTYTFSQWLGYCKNTGRLWTFASPIIFRKSYFYKVL